MENYPFDTVGLTADDVDTFQETYNALKTKFNISLPGYIDFQLEQFEVFKNYMGIAIRGAYNIKHLNCSSYIFFIETQFKNMPVKGRITDACEYQTWALAYLKQDFGRVLIRRETLADKIVELVHPVELDFADDKAFSDTFYVLVNDHLKANLAINRNFRNAVMDIRHEDFIIEIIDHTLIIGCNKPVSPERAVHMADFVSRLSSMC